MSINYNANPIDAPKITRPGESAEYIGTRSVVNLLPSIFRTTVNTQFMNTTLEQLMTSGSLQAINYYVGTKNLNSEFSDSYLVDNRESDNYQFVPGAVNRDDQGNITGVLSYDDLVNSLRFNEAQVQQPNRALNEIGYTLDLPINYDMFINYHKYFWLVDTIPVCDIKPTNSDTIVIDDIEGEVYYTTPTLSTGNTLTFKNGMRIRFAPNTIDDYTQSVSGNTTFAITTTSPLVIKVYLNTILQEDTTDYTIVGSNIVFNTAPSVDDNIQIKSFLASGTQYSVDDVYLVDGVGDPTGIKLTKVFESNNLNNQYGKKVWFNQTIYSGKQPSKWDADDDSFEFKPFDLRELGIIVRDYVVEQRWSRDQSAWARSNLWVHEDVIQAACLFAGEDPADYVLEEFRAVRPIIEFKANLKKYNFGENHIAYVTHVFDTVTDPSVSIVGNTSWDLASFSVTTAWSNIGYSYGDKVTYTISGNVTYWDCIKSHSSAKNPSWFENREYWRQVTAKELEDGDTILFLNSTNATYNNKIFTVSGVLAGTGIVLTETYNFDGSGSAVQINENDKILAVIGYNSVFSDTYDGDVYSGSEWYWNGNSWVYGQQKDHRSEGPRFQLYDFNLTPLNDAAVYPNSNFQGDRIFDYARGSGVFDDALGFSPKYVDYGNAPGLSFDLELGAKRYEYNPVNANDVYKSSDGSAIFNEIKGYYFFKNLETNRYYNGWAIKRGGQPVRYTIERLITDSNSFARFNLGTENIYSDNRFVFSLYENRIKVFTESTLNAATRRNEVHGTNPVLYMARETAYTIYGLFDDSIEFVNVDGSALTGLTSTVVDDYTTTVEFSSAITANAIRYQLASDSTVNGIVYLLDSLPNRNIKVYTNRVETTDYTISGKYLTLNTTLPENTIVTVTYHSDSIIDTPDGVYETSETQLFNPQNNWLTEVSFGDLQLHMKDQMNGIPNFTGNYFGSNNYNEIAHAHDFGGTIMHQPFSTELLSQAQMDVDTNIFASVKFSSNQYERFKNQLLQKARQLHNRLDQTVPVYQLFDEVMKTINIGKNSNDLFVLSNVLNYRDFEHEDYVLTASSSTVLNLPYAINTYGDQKNHVQLWIRDYSYGSLPIWRSLTRDIDYVFVNEYQVNITSTINFGTPGFADVHVRWYPINSVSFVPPSAVCLGIRRPTIPSLVYNFNTDSNSTSSKTVLLGHDGSIHVTSNSSPNLFDRSSTSFNIDDAILWEFENRIYNNLSSSLENVLDYKEIMPKANVPTPYTWDDLTNSLNTDFNKWKIKNNITELSDSSFYDALDRFTWNYSTVAPFIGGWRGIYTYYFNTDRPHTHPWEMFGYNKKPSWWDDNYSWTNVTKRAALIEALKYGHYNDPAESIKKTSQHYAYNNYDWDSNVLVTTLGVLNDPVTAGVVSTPTVNVDKEFEFGDWGPIENAWRRSSEYQISIVLGLLKLRPLWVINNYFNSNIRSYETQVGIDYPFYRYSDSGLLKNTDSVKLSYLPYQDSILEKIKVLNSGSGYTVTPTLTIFGNFGNGATARAIVDGGEVVAVTVDNPGHEYQSTPLVEVSSGSANFESFLLRSAKKYFVGLNNSLVEFARYNHNKIEDLQERFKNINFSPIIKTGGFVNSAAQTLILESSQNKGRVAIPEENFEVVLYKSQPREEYFYGGIKITKTSDGFLINGYDNSNQYFNYFEPNTGTRLTIVTVGSTLVNRYRSFHTEIPKQLFYNTTLRTLQDLYNFINGYGEYLKSRGWNDDWISTANNAVLWAQNSNQGDIEYFIPNKFEVTINENETGYFDNTNNRYDGVYNIIDRNGNQILSNKVIITRELLDQTDPATKIISKDSTTEIYGVRLYRVELEHAIVVDPVTSFDDIVYKPELGQRHNRVIWRGSRTKDWNGKLYAPGFIVNDNTIINNFDTTAREIDQYYGHSSGVNNTQILDVARFNLGYNKPQWSLYTELDDDTIFNFVKGVNKYKGTKYALDAFMRNTSLFGLIAGAGLYEEWAIRSADYGDIRSRDKIEFELSRDLLKTSPQPVRFTQNVNPDVLTDLVIDIDPSSSLLLNSITGEFFETRGPKTYNNTTISSSGLYANDFLTSGLPLTTEADYKIINNEDFIAFPEEVRDAYDFSGEWQNIFQWNNKTSYKFRDKVLYQGKTWEMLDPDGASGLTRPNDPITVTGTITLPTVPSSGQTLIIDGNTVNIQNTSTQTTFNLILVTGTNDIGTTAVVPSGSTLILGNSSTNATTVTFENISSSVVYQPIIYTGTIANPVISGSLTKKLTIDGVDVLFDDTETVTQNITALVAFENGFNESWTVNNTVVARNNAAIARISAIENLRLAYIAASSVSDWETFLAGYFSNTSGLNISFLLTEYNAGAVSYASQIEALLDSDLTIINNIAGTSYVTADVLDGSEVVDSNDIVDSQNALDNGIYIDDVATWLQDNPSTVFESNTIVLSTTTGEFQSYNLAEIIDKINNASIDGVTASNASNRLRITKTTTTSSLPFSLTINSATANAEVGFSSTTTTILSQGNVESATSNLTINQVIEQINAASIPTITARSVPSNSNLLQIVCNDPVSLYIGNGTANSVIGLTSGITPATSSVTTVPVASDITAIVNSINNAGIVGVTASNGNNRLRIISVNSTLTIGAGTANSTVGLTAQTYSATSTTISNVFNAIVGSDGNQVFREMENDPNVFSIWIADNSSENNTNAGYEVLQTMTFGMYIARACAGITAADDAEITVSIAGSTVQAHNLAENDYVLIRGSNTVPSIDGIHRVTSVDQNSTLKFFIDKYIDKEGNAGNIYPLRSIRFSNFAELLNEYDSTVNGIYKYNFSGVRQNNEQQPVYAFVDDNGSGIPAVYRYTGEFNINSGHYSGPSSWREVRRAAAQSRNDLISGVKIYDSSRKSLVNTIEVWDPAKGIIPGFIEKEIDFKLTADLALYNYSNISGFVENAKAWSDQQVGLRWWNISNAVYLEYEQGSVDYQQNNWGRLFDGASIDVYEWTRSPVLPSQWQDLVNRGSIVDGVQASGEVFKTVVNDEEVYRWTEQTYYNPDKNRTENSYYFWVKNKTSHSGQRSYNTYQLSRLLENPNIFDIQWCAASESNVLLLANVANLLTDNTVVQVNKKVESNALPLAEWMLLSENDPTSIIPEYLHIKLRDSIVGYNKFSKRYSYETFSVSTNYNKDSVVLQSGSYYISIDDNNLGNSPALDTDQNYWRKILDYEIATDTQENKINVFYSQTVPDVSLHPFSRYGHLIRPRQSLFRNLVDARQNLVYTINSIFKNICAVEEFNIDDSALVSSFQEGNITYNVKKYWNYVDWVRVEQDSNGNTTYEFDVTKVPNIIVDTYDQLPATFDFLNGEPNNIPSYAYVKNVSHVDGTNRPEIYESRGSQWVRVWKKLGTIEFSEELWNQNKYGHGFDVAGFDLAGFDNEVSNVLAKILDELRYNILVSQFAVNYNKIWFSCLKQAIADNTADDFAFMTTFVKLYVDRPLLTNKRFYSEYSMTAVEQFMNTVKPFHTKVRSLLDRNTTLDESEFDIIEQSRQTEISLRYNDHSDRSWAETDVLLGGTFVSGPTNIDVAEFTTDDADIEYIYDGNSFIQPVEEGWGEELYPVDYTENVSILVQTNFSGNTETADTRTFRMNYFYPQNEEESTVIVNNAKTAISADINESVTSITVNNSSLLTDPAGTYTSDPSISSPRGVVWIGKERIEYGAIDGNTLRYCIRGTKGTPATSHTAGDIVIDASWPYLIPTLDHFYDYGNNLRPAYNDLGVSLSVPGSSIEHAFIRNAGYGTI